MKKNVFVFNDLNVGLAYLLGVYLGDGSVDKIRTSRSKIEPSYYFKLGSIDKDFVEYVRDACVSVVAPNVPLIRESHEHKKTVYRFSLGCADFCRWLLSECNGKNQIPAIIPRQKSFLTKAFLEGIIDSEGYVSYQEKHDWLISGFAVTSAWAHEVAELLQKQGVKLGKCTQYYTKKGTLVYSYRFNITTYYETANMRFHLARKHNRVLQYLESKALRDYHSNNQTG